MCDPLLAGLPRDTDYSVPCYCSSPSPSNSCLLANGKCDKYSGASSDKILDYTIHWSRAPESETLGPVASENTVTSTDWRTERNSGHRSHGSPHFPNPDSQERCNDQDLVKKHQSITKVTPTWGNPFLMHCNLLLWGLGRVLGQGGPPQESPLLCVFSTESSPQCSALKMF